MRSMTIEEHDNFKKYAKCDWRYCAGGMGLAGQGVCSFRGEWSRKDCPKYMSDDDYENKLAWLM